jgi:hypothetical protein
MCVLCIKNKGVEMPTERELRLAYEHNPHGCGFVSSNGLYWRGMDFNEFMRRIKGVSKEDACIIHFRIATHGSVSVKNCHPFVGMCEGEKVYFAHNGILPIRAKKDMTDSETEFRNVLLPAMETFGYRSDIFAQVVGRRIHSSKFAFMKGGVIRVFGSWICEDNGLLWSNLNHRIWGHFSPIYDHYRVIYV